MNSDLINYDKCINNAFCSVCNLHDGYNILTPMSLDFSSTPLLRDTIDKAFEHSKAELCRSYNSRLSQVYLLEEIYTRDCRKAVKNAFNLCHATSGRIYMKMLKFFEDGKEHNYRELFPVLFPGKKLGHDIDCYRWLVDYNLIQFTSKHARGEKFYTITPLGREALQVCKANDVFYLPLRWFAFDEDEMFAEMMKSDMESSGFSTTSQDDISPEAMCNLAKALLSPTSSIAKIGSRYRWFNKVMRTLATSKAFYEAFNVPEVNAWLDAHKYEREVMLFNEKWEKVQKKWSKKLAA